MGGWGSGGTNKTHKRVEDRQAFRIDSFHFADMLQYDKYTFCKNKVDVPGGRTHIRYYPQTKEAEIWENGAYSPLGLSRVKNIDGMSQRLYFICPFCDRRIRFLYRNLHNGFYMCRKCARLNYKSQQVSHGLEEMRLKMRRIVEDKLGYYGWEVDFDCIADLPVPPKPAYMRWEKYNALRLELVTLQAEYYEEFRRQALRILGCFF